jgi:FmdE, Molybdenum formylmethanofuran dehydrogenase operon
MNLRLRIGLLSLLLVGCGITTLRAETPEEWVKLGARVHGGFGAFIPVGIRIGEDAMKCLNAQPRELSVVYYSGEGVPCPCSVDGVMLAVSATPGKVLFRSRWRNRHPALSPWLSSGPARAGMD